MKTIQELDNTKQGKGVNWPTLYKKLSRLKIDDQLIYQAITIKQYSKKVYGINIIDHDAFEKIIQLAQPINKNSRAAASIAGNTHQINVNGALLVAVTEQSEAPYVHAFTQSYRLPYPKKQHAVIIENLECFLHFKDSYLFMSQLCEISHSIDDIEFIYAAGNSISNQNIIPYLKEFKGDIFCLLDIDIGGLQIYKNLLNNGLSIDKTHFVIPKDIEQRLKKSRRKASKSELNKLNNFLKISNQIDQLIGLMHYYQTTIEQESYRA